MKKFILFSALALFFIHCGSREEEIPPSPEHSEEKSSAYSGTYRLEPSAGHRLELKNTSAKLFDNEGNLIQEGIYSAGRASLRIFFNESTKPDAVYLLDDYKDDGWLGRWGEDMKILYRMK